MVSSVQLLGPYTFSLECTAPAYGQLEDLKHWIVAGPPDEGRKKQKSKQHQAVHEMANFQEQVKNLKELSLLQKRFTVFLFEGHRLVVVLEVGIMNDPAESA